MIGLDVQRSLIMVAQALQSAQDPWWIIGSAAVALHGGDPGAIADIDVIVSRRDIDALYDQLPLTSTPDEGKTMFSSDRFGRWTAPPLQVEFMAGLTHLSEGHWHAVTPTSRQMVQLDGHALFLPERAELIAILHRFGRDKDIARAATLHA